MIEILSIKISTNGNLRLKPLNRYSWRMNSRKAPALAGQNARKRAVIRRPMTRSSNLNRKSAPSQVSYRNSTTAPASVCKSRDISSMTTSRNKEYINDPDCITLRDKLLENPDFSEVEDEQLKMLMAHLREYSQDMALKEDYEEAAKASSLLEVTRKEQQERNSRIHERELDDADKIKREKCEKQWDEKLQNLDEETQAKREAIQNEQNEELDRFEKRWAEDMPRKYRKPSNRLLQLKQIERSLAISGKYDEAKEIHKESEAIAQLEGSQIQNKLITDYRIAREKLMIKFNEDMNLFEKSRAQEREVIECQKRKDLEKFVYREEVQKIKQIESRKGCKERSGVIKPDYGASVIGINQTKMKFRDNVIPPLFAPNDPKFVEEEQRKAREKKRIQDEYQKKNAELTLLDYTVQPSPRDGESDMSTNTYGSKSQTASPPNEMVSQHSIRNSGSGASAKTSSSRKESDAEKTSTSDDSNEEVNPSK